MIVPFVALVTLGQTALALPPAPPAPRADQMAEELRRSCLSEEGIAIVVDDWARGRESALAGIAESNAIYRELGEAAYTLPIDVDRLERAAQARNEHQALQSAETTRRSMESLRRMSPEDRAIYARRFSLMQTNRPQRICSPRAR